MLDVNITHKGEVVKTVKVPWTVASPVMYGAITAACGATVGVTAGFIRGVWEDGKCLVKLIKKK